MRYEGFRYASRPRHDWNIYLDSYGMHYNLGLERQNKEFNLLKRFIEFVLILLVATVCYGHLWGYDEDGREHRPVYLSEGEVESGMNLTESQLSPPTMKAEGIGLQTSCLHSD